MARQSRRGASRLVRLRLGQYGQGAAVMERWASLGVFGMAWQGLFGNVTR